MTPGPPRRRTFGARRVTRAALILLVAGVLVAALGHAGSRDHSAGPAGRQPSPTSTHPSPTPARPAGPRPARTPARPLSMMHG